VTGIESDVTGKSMRKPEKWKRFDASRAMNSRPKFWVIW